MINYCIYTLNLISAQYLIVLIGPLNIGRHELKQRMMADSDRFADAVPRKISTEVT